MTTLTNRSSGRVIDKVPSPYISVRRAQLNRQTLLVARTTLMTFNPFRAPVWILAAATSCLAGCATSQPRVSVPVACAGSAPVNREVVLSFYRMGLVGHRPRDAFEQFATVGMVEHKPDVPGGTRASVVKYLEELIAELPAAQWEVLRVAAEGDLVFLHAKFVPAPGADAYAIADVFKLQDCKIVEHWDIVAPPAKDQSNPNSRF